MRCEQFALCRYQAIGTVVHPVLGGLPTCYRCAERLGLLDALVPYPAGPCPTCKAADCLGELLDELHADRAVGWLLHLRELRAAGLSFDEALAAANEEAEALDAYRAAVTPDEAEDAVNELARLHRPTAPAPVFGP